MICTTSIGTVKNASKGNYPIEMEALWHCQKDLRMARLRPFRRETEETADHRAAALHPQSPAAGC